MSLLSSTKGKWDINRVEMTFEDILGKGSFGEPFAVAATPREVGTVITIIVIDNVFFVSVYIYLLHILLRILTVKTEVEFVI